MRTDSIGHHGQFPAKSRVESLHFRQTSAQKDGEGDVATRVVAAVCNSAWYISDTTTDLR